MVDTEIKIRGFEALSGSLGLVDAERFVFLLHRDCLDYTQWRKKLFPGVSGEEISRRAMQYSQQRTECICEEPAEYETARDRKKSKNR